MEKISKLPKETTLQWAVWLLTVLGFMTALVQIVHFTNFHEGAFLIVTSIISFVILLMMNILFSNLQKAGRDLKELIAEKELINAREKKQRDLIENIPFDMWLSDHEGRYVLQSARSRELMGDIIGKTPREMELPEGILEQWEADDRRVMGGETIFRESAWPVNGQYHDYITAIAPVHQGQSFLGYVGVHFDITERKRAEKRVQHTAEQLAMLNDIGRAITTLGDVDSVLNIIREQVQRILPVDAFIVLLYQPETNMVSYPLVYDNGRNWHEPDRELALDMKSHEVLKTGHPLLINLSPEEFENNSRNSNRSLTGDRDAQYRSFIYAPLIRQDKVIGVVSAISYHYNMYNQEHLELLEGVAIQATIAIENARLFQSQQKELAERKQAEEEIRKLNAELEERVEIRTVELKQANTDLNHEKARLEEYNHQREILAAMIDLLQASLTTEEASDIVSSHLTMLLPNKDGALYLMNAHNMLELIASWGDGSRFDAVYAPTDCWGMRRGKPYKFGGKSPNPPCLHAGTDFPGQSLCVPLSAQGESLGNLYISDGRGAANDGGELSEQSFVVTVADSIALALANLRLREKLHIQSIRDALTGLFNRRYLDETLPRELNRAERNNAPLSILMFDIDHFKKFNDTYGHDAGDVVLKHVAQAILSSTRESDIACRYGGEEFVIMLPDTSIEVAVRRAEALRSQVSFLELNYNGKELGRITISIGVSGYPQHGDTRDSIIKSADEAAYQAKQNGRNCVVVSKSAK